MGSLLATSSGRRHTMASSSLHLHARTILADNADPIYLLTLILQLKMANCYRQVFLTDDSTNHRILFLEKRKFQVLEVNIGYLRELPEGERRLLASAR